MFRIQDDDSIMCRFYCIAFIKYMIAGKTYTNRLYQACRLDLHEVVSNNCFVLED